MISLYKKIVDTGQDHTDDLFIKKKIALLNTYIMIWMHLSLFFIALDIVFVPPNQLKDIVVHTISLSILFVLLLLNFTNKFNLSRIIYVVLSFVVFYFLSFKSSISPYTVCYFIFLPLVVMSLYRDNVMAYLFLVLCLFVYNWNGIWEINPNDNLYFRSLILIKDPVVTSLFLAAFFLFLYFKKLNHNNEEKLEIAYQKLEETRKTEVAYLQLKSLKAQMNPHFMFNAMNSIQSLILKDNKHDAYQYLSKFSSMLRENLNMSEKSFVSFEEELSLLKKYLDLEELRFRGRFVYSLKGVTNIKDIKIPSMIIQPFVENSIKHGLFHKIKGEEKLTIEFKQNEVFQCIITDNGIGIKRSQEINRSNNVNKDSFSTEAINERLQLLKDYYKTDIGIEYIPVEIGTKVIVKIPYI